MFSYLRSYDGRYCSGFFTYLTVFTAVLLSGCVQPVGGPCEYQEFIGIASPAMAEDGSADAADKTTDVSPGSLTSARFAPVTKTDPELQRWMNIDYDIPAYGLSGGKRYPARLSVIDMGSCTPVSLTILADDNSSLGLPLEFDDEGRPTEQTLDITQQVAAAYKSLQQDWPDIKLAINGQADFEYSQEYRWNLARHYESQFKLALTELGVKDQQVEVFYQSEDHKEGDHIYRSLPLSGNGLRVYFVLQ